VNDVVPIVVAQPGGIRLRVRCTRSAVERLVGLIAQPLPAPGSGLWIEPCRAVHTCGVRGPLDLVFVGAHGVVLRICEDVRPGSVRAVLRARAVLELRGGEARRLGLRPRMRLCPIGEASAETGESPGEER